MYRIAILTISDKGSAGLREDLSGPAIQRRTAGIGLIIHTVVLPNNDGHLVAVTCR